MVMTNKELIASSLDLLRDALESYSADIWERKYGKDWLKKVNETVLPPSTKPDLADLADLSYLLKGIKGTWNKAFSEEFPLSTRALVFELADVRNTWAHGGKFSTDDTLRALDSMERLLGAFGKLEERGHFFTVRRDLMRQLVEEESPSERRKNVSKQTSSKPQARATPRRKVSTPPTDVASDMSEQSEFAADPLQGTSPLEALPRLAVRKTYKLFIGGALVRPESGKVTPVTVGDESAWVPVASRKDARDAVRAAARAHSGWVARTPYNRGQILYRLAEMLESRCGAFANSTEGDVAAAVDRLVYYAGWCDKLSQVASEVNQVSAGDFFNVSTREPCGVVAVLLSSDDPLVGLVDAVGSALCAGNTVLVHGDVTVGAVMLCFAEVVAVSDVPAGVVNLLCGSGSEVAVTLAEHGDVHAFDVTGAVALGCDSADLMRRAAGTLKRVRCTDVAVSESVPGPQRSLWATEVKTIWHPTGK